MEHNLQELAEKYSLPTLDYIDRETGDRVKHYLFTEEGLEKFLHHAMHRRSAAGGQGGDNGSGRDILPPS